MLVRWCSQVTEETEESSRDRPAKFHAAERQMRTKRNFFDSRKTSRFSFDTRDPISLLTHRERAIGFRTHLRALCHGLSSPCSHIMYHIVQTRNCFFAHGPTSASWTLRPCAYFIRIHDTRVVTQNVIFELANQPSLLQQCVYIENGP